MTIFLHKNDLPEEVKFSSSVAIDTETMGLQITRDRLCLIQISDGNGDAHLIQIAADNREANNLKSILTDEKILKIFHFARFDLSVLQHHFSIEIKNIYCTKIASRLTRTYTDSHGLKSICDELLSVDISKKQQSSDWGNVNLTSKQKEYAASDVLHLHALKKKLDAMLIREGRMDIFHNCLDFLPTRVKLDLQGFANLDIFAH